MIGLLLPKTMTAEERRGFRMACACFATVGHQLAAEPRLHAPGAVDATRREFQKHGRVISAFAAALDRTLGSDGFPAQALAELAAPD
jgi:hypothetical protein